MYALNHLLDFNKIDNPGEIRNGGRQDYTYWRDRLALELIKEIKTMAISDDLLKIYFRNIRMPIVLTNTTKDDQFYLHKRYDDKCRVMLFKCIANIFGRIIIERTKYEAIMSSTSYDSLQQLLTKCNNVYPLYAMRAENRDLGNISPALKSAITSLRLSMRNETSMDDNHIDLVTLTSEDKRKLIQLIKFMHCCTMDNTNDFITKLQFLTEIMEVYVLIHCPYSMWLRTDTDMRVFLDRIITMTCGSKKKITSYEYRPLMKYCDLDAACVLCMEPTSNYDITLSKAPRLTDAVRYLTMNLETVIQRNCGRLDKPTVVE